MAQNGMLSEELNNIAEGTISKLVIIDEKLIEKFVY